MLHLTAYSFGRIICLRFQDLAVSGTRHSEGNQVTTKETRDDKEERLFGEMRALEHRYRSADPA
jgi:hypothetical protein